MMHERRTRNNYNKHISKARIIVKNAMGALRMRFPILINNQNPPKKLQSTNHGLYYTSRLDERHGFPPPNDAEINAEYQNMAPADDLVEGNDDWDGVVKYFGTRTLVCDFVLNLTP